MCMPSQPIKGPLLPLVQRDPLLPHSTVPLLLNIPLQITLMIHSTLYAYSVKRFNCN